MNGTWKPRSLLISRSKPRALCCGVGSYVLMLVDLPADRFTVCTLKAVEHHIIATVFANPNLPTEPAGQ